MAGQVMDFTPEYSLLKLYNDGAIGISSTFLFTLYHFNIRNLAFQVQITAFQVSLIELYKFM